MRDRKRYCPAVSQSCSRKFVELMVMFLAIKSMPTVGYLIRWMGTAWPSSNLSCIYLSRMDVLPVDWSPKNTTLILLFTCASEDSDFLSEVIFKIYIHSPHN